MIKYRFAEGKPWDDSVEEVDEDAEDDEDGEGTRKSSSTKRKDAEGNASGGDGATNGATTGAASAFANAADGKRPSLAIVTDDTDEKSTVEGNADGAVVKMNVLGVTPEASMLLRLTKVPVHELVLIDPEEESLNDQEARELAHEEAFWGGGDSAPRARRKRTTPARGRGTHVLTSGLTIVAEESPSTLILGLKARAGASWSLNPALLAAGGAQLNVDLAVGTVVLVGFKEVSGSAIQSGLVRIGDELAAVNGIPVVRDVVSGHGVERSFQEGSKILQEEKGRSAAARKMLVLKFVRTTTATTPIDGRGMSRRLRTKNPELEKELQQQQASRQANNAWQNAGDANRFNVMQQYFDVECAPGPLGINFRPAAEDGCDRMTVASFCQTRGATQRGGRVGIGHVLTRVGSMPVPADGGEESLLLARRLLKEAGVPCTLVFRDPDPEPPTTAAAGATDRSSSAGSAV
jgi:hypothetical protein